MTRALFVIAALLAIGVAMFISMGGGATAQQPDIGAFVDDVDRDLLYAHVDAIDDPRSARQQPARLLEAGQYVEDELASYGLPVTRDPVTGPDGIISDNIIGVQEGTMCPERVFVVGAHYDSIAQTPGADDNASGVAGMLETARLLSQTDLPATVWYTGFTMEELGLWGGAHMAFSAADDGTQIVGMYSLEMIGYTAGPGNDFVAVIGNEGSVRLSDAYKRASERYVPELPSAVLTLLDNGNQQSDSRRSDHAPFWDAGFQALLVTDTANFRNPHYHQTTDTIDTLDFAFMTNVTAAIVATTADYLTYDGDNNGEPDVCSGPLVATATPTGQPTPTAPPAIEPASTPTPAPSVLPDTGDGEWDSRLPIAAISTAVGLLTLAFVVGSALVFVARGSS